MDSFRRTYLGGPFRGPLFITFYITFHTTFIPVSEASGTFSHRIQDPAQKPPTDPRQEILSVISSAGAG